MKTLLSLIFAAVFTLNASAQEKPIITLNWSEPIQKFNNTQYELIDMDDWGTATIKVTKFNPDGSILQDGYYVGGKKHGLWTLYNDGQPVSELQYSYNNRLWIKVYKETGYDIVTYRENKPVLIRTEHVLASN
jgi:antitoxin component YwqK of YwqJK toxin-antitoxin module